MTEVESRMSTSFQFQWALGIRCTKWRSMLSHGKHRAKRSFTLINIAVERVVLKTAAVVTDGAQLSTKTDAVKG